MAPETIAALTTQSGGAAPVSRYSFRTSVETVVRGLKDVLSRRRTGSPLVVRDIGALPKLGMVIRSRERLEVLIIVDASVIP